MNHAAQHLILERGSGRHVVALDDDLRRAAERDAMSRRQHPAHAGGRVRLDDGARALALRKANRHDRLVGGVRLPPTMFWLVCPSLSSCPRGVELHAAREARTIESDTNDVSG